MTFPLVCLFVRGQGRSFIKCVENFAPYPIRMKSIYSGPLTHLSLSLTLIIYSHDLIMESMYALN